MSPANRTPLLQAAASILAAAGGRLPITSLNKALFYLDVVSLRDHGVVITGTTYLALPAGPVVAKYEKRLVQALEDAGVAQQDDADDGMTKPVCLVGEVQPTDFSNQQVTLIQRVGAWASKRSASDLSEYSHRNDGWKIAWDQGLGSKLPAKPINLRIAMQQILDDDPWLESLPIGDVADAFASADSDVGVDL